MANHELSSNFQPSPEVFDAGRGVLSRSFSPDNRPDNEPDYDEMIEKDRRRLLDAIENEPREHTVYQKPSIDPKDKKKKPNPNPWEPFNSEPQFGQRFVNLYIGQNSQYMELNRMNAERLLDVAAIDGQVILVDLPMHRSRGIAGLNSDGSVTKRRSLFFGEKLEEDEDTKSLVTPTEQGWKIEIQGQEIINQLSRKDSKIPLKQRFTDRFNQAVRDSLREVIFRDRLKSEKNGYFKAKFEASILCYGVGAGIHFLFKAYSEFRNLGYDVPDDFDILGAFAWALTFQGMFNYMNSSLSSISGGNTHKSVKVISRTLKDPYEYIMPYVEIDRYTRGIAFMKNKGRDLVRLAPKSESSG